MRSLELPLLMRRSTQAFTLVELLLAVTLLVFIIAVVAQITQQTGQVWRSSVNRIQSFQESRAAFESMTRTLNQATLNTYHDYYNSANQPRNLLTGADRSGFVPATYDRISDLHFIAGQSAILLAASPTPITTQTHGVFFQAPLGRSAAYDKLRGTLNACGYFLQFGSDAATVPDPVKKTAGYKPRYRYRLMEMTQRTERLGVYNAAASAPHDWFVNEAGDSSRMVAENVIALIMLPKLSAHDDSPSGAGSGVSMAPHYNYNSRVPRAAMNDPAWPEAMPSFPPDQFVAYPATGPSPVGASRHHQLPPLMRVTMVVIDEASAKQLQGDSITPPKAIDFTATSLFQNASALDADVKAVEDICNARPGNLTQNPLRLTYRVFTTEIILREAKWSAN